MNLISDPWIPVRRADGSRQHIAPWQLTGDIANNPVLAVASPRPDFDGALTQFLIGLLQTTCTPDLFTWRTWQSKPPAPEELKGRFEAVKDAFELEGKKAFMQDFNPAELNKTFEISALLIGSPGEDSDTDLFIKQGTVSRLCPRCAAAAIFALQTNAPEGGRGYRTGLRGGGPLTTLVLGSTLWETCWLNVLEKTRYASDLKSGSQVSKDRFPWLAKTRTSEAKPPAGTTTPTDVHPDQQYWAMPRRIRLTAEETISVNCDLCGSETVRIYRQFRTRNYGVNYTGFEHPLSPHYVNNNVPNPSHPKPGGIGYRHWLGLVENSTDGDTQRRPAKVVEQFRTLCREDGRLWAFGFDMKSNKARCWYDATMPILGIEEDLSGLLTERLAGMVRAANFASGLVMTAVIRATMLEAEKKVDDGQGIRVVWKWPRDLLARLKLGPTERSDAIEAKVNTSGEELNRRIDRSLLSGPTAVRGQFWAETEVAFFRRAAQLREVVRENADPTEISKQWLSDLKHAARSVFQAYGRSGDFDVDPRRIALAELDLDRMLNGTRLRQLLLVP